MIITINSSPIGISLPQSAIDIIRNLPVEAKKVGDKCIVKKSELVERVNGINGWRANFLNDIKGTHFKFKCTE